MKTVKVDRVVEILKRHGILPKKRLGQCFLHDRKVAERIVALADPGKGETVIEIGAGVGLMTRLLAERAGRVIALELDPPLVAVLREELGEEEKIEIVETDVLKYDFHEARGPGPGRLAVVGNIPYYLSSPLLFYLLDFRREIERAVLMVQEEVAERLAATPGSRAYGIPSVIISMYADVTRDLSVGPDRFYPRPKVCSAVVTVRYREASRLPLASPDLFSRLVKVSFAGRRKTLFNNLRGAGIAGLSPPEIINVLSEAGIDGKRRAETLSALEFGHLSNVIFAYLG